MNTPKIVRKTRPFFRGSNHKEENSHLEEKAWLRYHTLSKIGKRRVTVLDAYAGSGQVWNRVQELLPDVEIMRLAVEKRKSVAEDGAIVGDNLKVLPTLDLASFDLIDLDAFGFPNKQIAICAERAPDVPIVATVIANHYAPTPYPVCDALGLPPRWYERASDYPHLLFAKKRWVYWDHYLWTLGYTKSERLHMADFGYTKRYEVLYSAHAWTTLHSTNK